MNTDLLFSRYWAEIYLDNLVHNYTETRKKAGNRKMMCVIKGDAYGHGGIKVAETLERQGADYFAVALPEEALQLRKAGIRTPILILGICVPEWIPELYANDITVTIGSLESALQYEARLAKIKNCTGMKAHIAVNTGMNRIGLPFQQARDQIKVLTESCQHLHLEGIWTHFSCAGTEGENGRYTKKQYDGFMQVLNALAAENIVFPFVHCANSDTIATCGEIFLKGTNMVRPGIILYGTVDYSKYGIEMKPVMELKGRIMLIHTVQAGESVGYNRLWTAQRESRIATVGAGCTDGWPRNLSGKIEAFAGENRISQIGQLAMDQMMFDVTDAHELKIGDTVTFVGRDGKEEIFLREHAKKAGTGTSDMLAKVGKRVPHVYLSNGECISGESIL